ncbi:MAG TPA: type II CAAX endopeptidase family protein [Terracidiphilus sp.]|nr:type II CAAX endopeptidase family protein [Terracidiphilus sp.]
MGASPLSTPPGPMSVRPATASSGRLRAYLEFILAVVFYFTAQSVGGRAALRLAPAWQPLAQQGMILLLLVAVFAALGRLLDRQSSPVTQQGLPLRKGWPGEAGLGLAIGWGAAIICVLPLALLGGIAIVLNTQLSAWGWFLADCLYFALAAMAEEVAFRGYGFQRFEAVVGPIGASLGFAAFYAIITSFQPGASRLAICESLVFSILLSMAYVRTRALWFSWGLNFAWKASRAVLFGLSVSGISSHASVIEGDPMGPLWLTGGGYGLDASWLGLLVLLAALPVVYRLTRDLDFRYNAPVLIPGGIPVDIDAAAPRQHEAAMGDAAPAPAPLVQIQPVSTPVTPAGTQTEAH